jgi:hypothetical protein
MSPKPVATVISNIFEKKGRVQNLPREVSVQSCLTLVTPWQKCLGRAWSHHGRFFPRVPSPSVAGQPHLTLVGLGQPPPPSAGPWKGIHHGHFFCRAVGLLVVRQSHIPLAGPRQWGPHHRPTVGLEPPLPQHEWASRQSSARRQSVHASWCYHAPSSSAKTAIYPNLTTNSLILERLRKGEEYLRFSEKKDGQRTYQGERPGVEVATSIAWMFRWSHGLEGCWWVCS